MRVHCECQPVVNYPAPVGAHALAWSYLLDTIFAEAYHAGVAELRVVVPSVVLEPEVLQRAQLSHSVKPSIDNGMSHGGDDGVGDGARHDAGMSDSGRVATAETRALAWLCPVSESLRSAEADHLYTLHQGWFAPLRSKLLLSPPELAERWTAAESWKPWYVLTWRVPLWGLLMRLGNQWQQPHWADWAMFSMRHQFMSTVAMPAFYTLRAWRVRR